MDNENVYIVQNGDTLYEIAERFGTTVQTLARYNGIPDPDVISVGEIIRLPDGAGENSVRIHIIQKGDTLYSLAKKYGTTVDELATINGIRNPDIIVEGRVLALPSPGLDTGSIKTYTVRSGDTLWSISRKFGTTVVDLINMNRISDPDMIYPGQVLRVRM